jgi:hypothetical protein
MGYAGASDIGAHARESQKIEAWATIKSSLHDINGQWIKNYHDRSVTFRHRKNGHNVRITLDGEVFIDVKLRNGDYRSEKHRADLKSATGFALAFLQAHV